MKTIEDFLSEFRSLDIKLWADGDRLRYRAHEGALSPALRAQLAERKAEILAFLHKANAAVSSNLPTILPVSREGNLPLSFPQERLWFLDKLNPGSSVYNLSLAFRLTGLLNVTAMEKSLGEILRRHEILRTTFPSVDGQPVQVISPDLAWTLPVVDLRQLPDAKREDEAQRIAKEEAQQSFDLAQGPLWRVKLLCRGEEEHVFVLTMHHIISDGTSLAVFLRELSILYEAFSKGKPSPLPELPIQYADFAPWQRQSIQDEAIKSQLDYWKQQLNGSVPALRLPTDGVQPLAQSYQGARQSLVLSKNLTDALKSLSQREGVTLFITLLAAFQTLLYRYTGQEDIILCSPVVGRNQSELEELIGYFNNILVMRTNLGGDPSFQELLGRVRRVATEAYEHEDVPLQKLAEFPNLVRTPLSRGMFALQKAPSQALKLPGVTVSSLDVHNGTANFDLSLFIEEQGETVTALLDYKTDLFNAKTITQMLENFQTLLESIVVNPEQHLSSLPLLIKRTPAQLSDKNGDSASCQQEQQETFVAPRNQLELQLTKIWEKVLGIQPIGIRDNFFALGGHSILAVRLFAEIEKIYGKNLPLAILLQASTVEQLANLLCQDGWSVSWSSLVPIQPGGSKPPLFCIHAVGGNVLTYVDLARHLGKEQPVYGLQARGIDGKGSFHTQIEEMAAHYIKEIRSFQPEGPYSFAGLSGGGVIAFEIAQQMVAQGHKVALVALFDSYNPKYLKMRAAEDAEYRRTHKVEQPDSILVQWQEKKEKVLRFLRHFLQLKPQERLPQFLEKAKRLKETTKHKIELIIYKFNPCPGRPLPYILRESAASEALSKAILNYEPQIYPGKVTLFRASASIFLSTNGPDNDQLGWEEFAAGGLEIHKVPGDHSSLVAEPNVSVLASILKNCLDQVLAEEGEQGEKALLRS